MSALCGIWNRNGARLAPTQLDIILEAHQSHGPDGHGKWLDGCIGMAHQALNITAEDEREQQPITDLQRNLVLVADVRLDNRPELINQLRSLRHLKLDHPTDGDLILAAYLAWGTECPQHLLGDFAFAVWDGAKQQLLLVRDPLGARSVCYYHDSNRFVFATDVGAILDLGYFQPQINQGQLARHLAMITGDKHHTDFEHVYYCPAATSLLVTRHHITQQQYWDISPDFRIRYQERTEYLDHLADLMLKATHDRLRTTHPVGISLSGGLDSTLVAAIAAKHLKDSDLPLTAYSYTFDKNPSCDETDFIQPLLDQYSINGKFINSDDKWVFANMEQWPIERDAFWRNPFLLLPTAISSAAQQDGCRVLLTGDYGDALFQSGSYLLADLLYEAEYSQAFKIFNATRKLPRGWTKVFNSGVRPLLPLWSRHLYRKFNRPRSYLRNTGLPDHLRQLALSTEPAVSGLPATLSPDRRRRYYSLLENNWALEQSVSARGLGARYNQVRVSPLYDRRLVEFMMAVPTDLFYQPGDMNFRGLQRDLMQHIGVNKVNATRKGKTMFGPLVETGLVEQATEIVDILIHNPHMVSQGLVKNNWLEEQRALGAWYEDSGLPFTTYLFLECWLRSIEDKKQGAASWTQPYFLLQNGKQ